MTVHGYNSFFCNKSENENVSITNIDISLLKPFHSHPFKIIDDDCLQELIDSVKEKGVLNPIVVRPMDDGEYEIISGHRRKYAAIAAELQEVPCIIRELNDDDAVVEMVDSNIYRQIILPSEKAWAYKMKYDAMKHQGKKGINTAEEIGKDFGDSGRQVQRYIKLTELIPELLDEIDNAPDKRLIIGVSLASLSKEEQEILYRFLDDENKFPSMKQAALISEASKNNLFSLEALVEIFSEGKEKHQSYKISLEKNFLQKFFGDKSKAEIEAELQNIITDYFFKRSVD